ncbi:MAG: hypothetical protein ABJ301_19505, partial [Rhodopirellula bahusiensis]
MVATRESANALYRTDRSRRFEGCREGCATFTSFGFAGCSAASHMKVTPLHTSIPVLLVVMLAGWASNECRADWPFPLLRPDGAQRIDVIG